jgi:hypothetical protein
MIIVYTFKLPEPVFEKPLQLRAVVLQEPSHSLTMSEPV